jgi:DNA-binding transcriptional MerR regulator
MSKTQETRYLGVYEAAVMLGKSETTLSRYYDRGLFPSGKKNARGERLYPEHEVISLREYLRGKQRLRNPQAFLASPAAGRVTMEARYSETLDATPALADPADLLRDLRDAESR